MISCIFFSIQVYSVEPFHQSSSYAPTNWRMQFICWIQLFLDWHLDCWRMDRQWIHHYTLFWWLVSVFLHIFLPFCSHYFLRFHFTSCQMKSSGDHGRVELLRNIKIQNITRANVNKFKCKDFLWVRNNFSRVNVIFLFHWKDIKL